MKLSKNQIGDCKPLVYHLGNHEVVLLGLIITNHSMSIDEAVSMCVDLDEVSSRLGWDGYDYDCIELLWDGEEIEQYEITECADWDALNDFINA